MKYNPNIHHRRSIRLKGYDYSQAGLYFITICCQDRVCLFGKITDGEMVLNDAGIMIETEWLDLINRFSNIELREFVVMPNHFHGILEIVVVGATHVIAKNDDHAKQQKLQQQDGQPQGIAPATGNNNLDKKNKTVGDMMDAFKSITTVEYIRGVKTLNWKPFNGKIWQRNYYEHIIRNVKSYQTKSDYIINNPAKWNDDKFYNQ